VRPARMEEAQRLSEDSGHGARSVAMKMSVLCARATPRAREREGKRQGRRERVREAERGLGRSTSRWQRRQRRWDARQHGVARSRA